MMTCVPVAVVVACQRLVILYMFSALHEREALRDCLPLEVSGMLISLARAHVLWRKSRHCRSVQVGYWW